MKAAEGDGVADQAITVEPLDTQTIDAVIDSLLGTDPPPHVFAVLDNGLSIDVPPEVPLAPTQAINGVVSPLELCIPGDLPALVEAWQRARVRRASQLLIRLRADPAHSVSLHLLDARHRFGVYLGILVGSLNGFAGTPVKTALFRPRVCSIDRDELSVVRATGPTVSQILGWTAEELIGGKTLEIIHPDDRPLAIANWVEMLCRPGLSARAVLRFRHRDGQYIWFEVTHSNSLNDAEYNCVRSEMVDVSERMGAIEALHASEQLLRRLTEALPLGVVQIDAARNVVYRNELLLEMLGTSDAGTIDEQFAAVGSADRQPLETALAAVLERGEAAELELTIEHDTGARRCNLAVRALSDKNGVTTGAILCVTDITERVRLREELERRAKYDSLTHCLNRASIIETLEAIIRVPPNAASGIAVVFVDLDRFKAINDKYGHAAGDEVLRVTGERLLGCVRDGDVVGRLGGDEFLVVCPDIADAESALALARRIAGSLAQVVLLGATAIVPGSSIGVAWTNRPISCDTIVASADEAMYASKRGAGGPVLASR